MRLAPDVRESQAVLSHPPQRRRRQLTRRRRTLGLAGLLLATAGIAVGSFAGYQMWVREAPVPTIDEIQPDPEPVAEPEPAPEPEDVPEPEPAPEPQLELPAAATPMHIEIEAIGVDHPVIPVGLLDDGSMEIPHDVNEIGWYHPGVMPGEIGSAVLAGHVDSRSQGPGAFFDLRLLEEGDLVTVTDESGVEWVWEVTLLVRYPKDELPIEDIFRWEGESADLVLITCGGEFDRTARSYEDNIVVYTELVSATAA